MEAGIGDNTLGNFSSLSFPTSNTENAVFPFYLPHQRHEASTSCPSWFVFSHPELSTLTLYFPCGNDLVHKCGSTESPANEEPSWSKSEVKTCPNPKTSSWGQQELGLLIPCSRPAHFVHIAYMTHTFATHEVVMQLGGQIRGLTSDLHIRTHPASTWNSSSCKGSVPSISVLTNNVTPHHEKPPTHSPRLTHPRLCSPSQ